LDLIVKVKELIKDGKYRMSFHAEVERDSDMISINEIEDALSENKCELIEDYPKDPRGHSFLLLGFTLDSRPIHAVCSIHEELLIIITVYRPDVGLWIDWRIRRHK
jgi:hypothetical protein